MRNQSYAVHAHSFRGEFPGLGPPDFFVKNLAMLGPNMTSYEHEAFLSFKSVW